MPRRLLLIAIALVGGLFLMHYYSLHDKFIPAAVNLHDVPAPFNASLGFGKIFYISLPEYAIRSFILI